MWLSKVMMDLSVKEVALDLVDRDRLHRKLLRLFPDYPGGAPNARELMRILFRVEAPVIYLQSAIAPISTRLPDGYTIVGTKEITSQYANVKSGSEHRFRLEANVCYRDSQSRRRMSLDSDQELEEWLFRRGDLGGFEIVDYAAETLPPIHARKGQFHAVRFEGVLKVKTVDSFMKALSDGIGPGKVYGLGLLSLGR